MTDVPCLICGTNDENKYCTKTGSDSDNAVGSTVDKQLNTIFILKHLLHIPTTQLEGYLEKFGNPDSWISLCDKCSQLTWEARSLHFQILKISSKLKDIRNKIVEISKCSLNSSLQKLKTIIPVPKMTVWKETRSFVQKHNYTNCDVISTSASAAHHHQQCPNCLTQIQIQLPPQLQQVNEKEEASKFHQCPYCTSQFPSITSLLKHIPTVHEMQRLPCLYPNCEITLKNEKNFWRHRQRHKRKVESESSKSPKKIKVKEPSSDDHFEGDHNIDDNHMDSQEDNIQSEPTSDYEESTKITEKEETPEDAEPEEESVSLGIPDDADFDDLQDNLDSPQDNDKDWLPTVEEEEAEKNTETDMKPDVTVTPTKVTEVSSVTEDTACFSTIIKGGTRTSQQCPQCPLKFCSISSTLRHLSTFHHLKKLPCLHPGCKSTLSTIKAYFKHRKLHLYPQKKMKGKGSRGPYKKGGEEEGDVDGPCLCDLCGASFKKKQYLNKHKIVVHLKRWKSVVKKVTCHLCGIPFKSGYLKKHILHMHKGQGEGALYQCGVVGCKRFYLRQEGLDNHMVKKHGGDDGGEGGTGGTKQFSCSYCGKGFCFKRKLEQHELSHRNQQLGIKPFVCEICGKGFGVPGNLTNHLKYTHKLAKRFQSKN